jgi:hypothetical protein
MKTNKIRFLGLLVTATLGLTNCGKKDSDGPAQAAPIGKTEDNVSKALFGSWGTLTVPLNDDATGVKMGELKLVMKIADGTVTISNSCHFDFGPDLAVDVTAPANITATSIQILAAKDNSKKYDDGSIKNNCNASIKQGSTNYQLNGNSLTLSSQDDTSKNYTLNRL